MAGTHRLKQRAPTRCLGHPNRGRMTEARQLRARSYLRIKTGSWSNTWGHSLLLQLINGGAREVATAVPGSITLVGDLSSREGGPLAGHASHQVGRDADVAFMVTAGGQPVPLTHFEPFDGKGRSLRHSGYRFDERSNWLMLRYWLSDLRVPINAVFVSGAIRRLLLSYGRKSPEFAPLVPLAKRVLKAHSKHTDHFHLRIGCPSDQGEDCSEHSVR